VSKNFAIFLSGRGSNMTAILDAIDNRKLDAKVVLVASNNSDAPGLRVAEDRGIPTAVFDRSAYEDGEEFATYMLFTLAEHKVDLIVLAGYLRRIPPKVVTSYKRRIINIHPALLPRHGGKGMFGMNVHRAVIESGEKETGVTIHYVDEIYDHGAVIAQRTVPVLPDDTPESLAQRVLVVEHQIYPEVLQMLVNK
jgi:phosphoribosylglycinamide formyltransferase-1